MSATLYMYCATMNVLYISNMHVVLVLSLCENVKSSVLQLVVVTKTNISVQGGDSEY